MLTPTLPKIALSYGLESLLSQQEELTTEKIAEAALQIYPEKVVCEGLVALCERLVQRVSRLADKQKGAQENRAAERKTLGYQLQEWAKTLDSEAVCLLLADYDPEKAHRLYWFVESELVDRALQAKLNYLAARQSSSFEATMYGFGGRYEGDGKAADTADAVDAFSEAGLAGLSEFGF
jgi:hypothetical protein